MLKPSCICAAVLLPLLGSLPRFTIAQDEGLPAIAREVYQPHTALPPAPAPRAVTERLVTEPPIVPPRVVDDTPTVAGAVVTPAAAVVTPSATVVTPAATVVAPAVVSSVVTSFSRYTFGFYDDGNADDNWYYDYYQVPKAAVVVKPTTDAAPGFRTNWTYDRREEAGLFSW
jgi:hypothetical protein